MVRAVVAELNDGVLLSSPSRCRIRRDDNVQRHVTTDEVSTFPPQIPKPRCKGPKAKLRIDRPPKG